MDTKRKMQEILEIVEHSTLSIVYSESIRQLPASVINDLYSMVAVSRQIKFTKEEIGANLTYDISCYNRGEAKLMRCLKPPFGKRSIYEDLQPNPDYPLYACDLGSYIGAQKELGLSLIHI